MRDRGAFTFFHLGKSMDLNLLPQFDCFCLFIYPPPTIFIQKVISNRNGVYSMSPVGAHELLIAKGSHGGVKH